MTVYNSVVTHKPLREIG